MEFRQLIDVVERILERSHAAVLTTVDTEGTPHGRWMVPTTLRGATGSLYAVTSPAFRKIPQVENHPTVSWLIQTKPLSEVVEVIGKVQVIDNPALKSDVLESLGKYIATFWRVNEYETELVVLETVIESIEYFKPMKGERIVATREG